MTKLTYKEQITQTVLEQLDDSTLTFEYAMKNWWQNPRRDGAMRLTSVGDLSFRYAKIEYHDHDISTKEQSFYKFVMELSKKIKCPYYLGVDKIDSKKQSFIRLYDSKIAMMINLYGSIEAYLDSIKIKNTT